MCAMMTNDMGNTDKLAVLLAETRSMGLEVLPPDVNEGHVHFAPTPDGKAIRFGLAAIKGVGEVAVEGILNARQQGRFTSLMDLCERVDARTINRKTLEALIRCGACDGFGETRAGLFASIDRTLARASSIAQDKQRGQNSLFGSLSPTEGEGWGEGAKNGPVPEWPQSQLLAAEKELLGFYVTGHPLTPYAPLLEKYGLHNSATAAQLPDRSMTRIGGMISAVQQGISKKNGKPYAMLTMEDLQGAISVLCFAENYDKYRDLFAVGKAVLIVGEVNNSEDKPKIFPQEIMPLDDAPRRYTRQVHLRLHTAHLTPKRLESARELALANPGKCPLFLCLIRPTGEALFIETHEKYFVSPSRQLRQAADDLFGEETYYAKIDTTLPERARRAWERKAENADE